MIELIATRKQSNVACKILINYWDSSTNSTPIHTSAGNQ